MKRSWLGLGLLILLLAAALAATWFMTGIHEDMTLDLEQSARCAGSGDWENAQLFLTRAEDHWTKWEHLCACFADHEPVEEMDAALAALKVYCEVRDGAAYRAACAVLIQNLTALGESHAPTWWNLL